MYQEVWNKWNVDFAYEVFAEDYVRHDLRPTEANPPEPVERVLTGSSKWHSCWKGANRRLIRREVK